MIARIYPALLLLLLISSTFVAANAADTTGACQGSVWVDPGWQQCASPRPSGGADQRKFLLGGSIPPHRIVQWAVTASANRTILRSGLVWRFFPQRRDRTNRRMAVAF